MPRTRVKICGVTNPEDARLAAELGADAIGIVFHPGSRRYVDEKTAKTIVRTLPAFVSAVGLFVDASPAEVRQLALSASVGIIQLHGSERAESVAALEGYPVIKAVRVGQTFEEELRYWATAIANGLPNLVGLVLETANTPLPGGTGVENDWTAIAKARSAGAFQNLPPLIAAGGLRPETVAEVIRNVAPWAVDVSSGVEESVGKKSPEKMRAFIHAVATS